MMIEREVSTELSTEIIKQGTSPFKLVKFMFPAGDVYLSEGPEVEYGGNTYLSGGVRVGDLAWDANLGQGGIIYLDNENNVASSIILSNETVDAPVEIYQTYVTSGGFATPELMVIGVLGVTTLSPTQASVTLASSRSNTEMVPSRFHIQENGFNHLPRAGTVVVWNNEKYVLEAGSNG